MNKRVSLVVADIGSLMHEITRDCCAIDDLSTSDFYVNLGRYAEKVATSIHKYFLYISDFEDLYNWLDLPTDWIKKDPYDKETNFYSFFHIFDKKDGGWEIIDKITCDLEEIKEESKKRYES